MNRVLALVLPASRRALAGAALAALALAGCGEKSEPGSGAAARARTAPMRVVLDYLPNADHAGLYAALAAGEYERGGLDVTLTPPPDPAAPLKLLAAGRADLAISYEPELLLARDQGATDLVAVAAVVQKPLTSLMSVGKQPIRDPRQLAGKRVGTAGIPYQSAYLKTILHRAGVDPASVKETNVGFNLTAAMLSGKVDATLGAFWNYEGVDLQRRGRHPVALRMDQLGVPSYAELVLVARREDLDADGASRVRRFIQASGRGYALLKADPARGADALLQADKSLDRGLQEASIRATLPVFFPGGKQPWGWQDRAEWDRYAAWMKQNGLLKGEPNGGAALTTEFLAGQQLDPNPAGLDEAPGQG
jgi:putative hydroxymethylpyrimidine transport system substrate-binding protein